MAGPGISRSTEVPVAIRRFLGCETPRQWLQDAVNNTDLLLLDHANCELKAAGTAMRLMFRYPQHASLVYRMSRLAREELRHFEQVQSCIDSLGIERRQVTASRYASGLRKLMRREEPGMLVDTLIIGAFIEARSCERFAMLAPLLESQLGDFYRGLLASESRHFEHYLELARHFHRGRKTGFGQRVAFFRAGESGLCQAPDRDFRFHSGPLSPQAMSS